MKNKPHRWLRRKSRLTNFFVFWADLPAGPPEEQLAATYRQELWRRDLSSLLHELWRPIVGQFEPVSFSPAERRFLNGLR